MPRKYHAMLCGQFPCPDSVNIYTFSQSAQKRIQNSKLYKNTQHQPNLLSADMNTLINMLPAPLLRILGSRWEYIILMGLPLRGVKFSISNALAAVKIIERGRENLGALLRLKKKKERKKLGALLQMYGTRKHVTFATCRYIDSININWSFSIRFYQNS